MDSGNEYSRNTKIIHFCFINSAFSKPVYPNRDTNDPCTSHIAASPCRLLLLLTLTAMVPSLGSSTTRREEGVVRRYESPKI